ncbi:MULTISPECIES: hypothetical protein [Bacillus]|uniref:DUF4870 domain-containing protein n=2 Tax=Bacillus cereus group TaxID=86661 RepID=A0A2C1D3P0_BACCE|nr:MULTISPECIES: hypothetical protein [Bacillus cereus group]OFD77160.1 hypothetical protein BWGOE8_32720 [Bacillus mycoides]OFD77416.1 hypothetical protein BWGOE9_32900 [Bacillus mycoides]OFD78127.1 hypothetical protein BWGOE10_33250 [Bacillus mycoides]PGS94930.1 hypothetical protein COD09_23850 [Bacillus cereus]
MNLSQDKNQKLILHLLTFVSFIILVLLGITIFYIPFIFYYVFKSKEVRTIIIETSVYQLLTWIISFIWNIFIMKPLVLSISDISVNNMSIILWAAPLYIILTILLVLGPLKGILYVLQGKDFHYPIISKWIRK